ncbi:MAG: histidine phosphatase family protein [Bacteroidia bacterium]|nr:histidine phosphatase family protein [Bacteroidia bacterium]
MKKLPLLFLLMLLMEVPVACAQNTLTTFILIRHAEKGDDGTRDPDLNAQGMERAKLVASMLEGTQVDAIYSTPYKRTTHTVTPLAVAKKLEVKSYDPLKADPIQTMLAAHRGGTIVVCGHSNTIPWTANLLTGTNDMQQYDDNAYNILLVVSVYEMGKVAKVTRLHFGQ